MKDVLTEVFAVMRGNWLRLLLTGFSIGWGLFILVVMVGVAGGVTRGVTTSFGADTICTLYLSQGTTSLPWLGHNALREIPLHEADAQTLAKAFPRDIRTIDMQNQSPTIDITANTHQVKTKMRGVPTGYYRYAMQHITAGRDFTPVDLKRHNRVCLIGRQTADILYGKDSAPIGETLLAGGIPFRVVGVFDSTMDYGSGNVIYIPFTTGKDLFAPDGKLNLMVVVANDVTSEEQQNVFRDKIYGFLAKRLEFNPNDRLAVSCKCYSDQYFRLMSIHKKIRVFIWIVGLAMLVSGIVSISNIMFISIGERTREFGVRMAMGATDQDIISLVLTESIIIAILFGYVGMLSGIMLTQAMAWGLKEIGGMSFFENPTVDFTMMMISLLIMTIAGLLAGLFPARHVLHMKLVDSIHHA